MFSPLLLSAHLEVEEVFRVILCFLNGILSLFNSCAKCDRILPSDFTLKFSSDLVIAMYGNIDLK